MDTDFHYRLRAQTDIIIRNQTGEKLARGVQDRRIRVFFYANEGQEPIHIHVRKAGGFAKFWIEPIELDYAERMKTRDLARAETLIAEHLDVIREKWNEVHGR